MELRQLRSFIAVAEDGNISRAAKKLHFTQSALSRQIKSLEESLEVPLFDRGAHSVKLTREGEVLLMEARHLIQRADWLLAKVRAVGQVTTLRIGYAPSLAAGMLPQAIQAFAQRHPKVRVELADCTTREMRERLNDGSLDLAVTVKPGKPDEQIHVETLTEDVWRVAMSPIHPLAQHRELEPEQLNAVNLLMFCQEGYPEYWSRVTPWFKKKGIDARVVGEYDGVNSLVAAIEAGLGVALVLNRLALNFPDRLELKPLVNPPPAVEIVALALAQRMDDSILRVFLEELRRAA